MQPINYKNDLLFHKWTLYVENLDITAIFEDCYKNNETLADPLMSTECIGVVEGNKSLSEINSVSTKIKINESYCDKYLQEYNKENDIMLLFEADCDSLTMEIVGFVYGDEKLTKEEFRHAYKNLKACFEWG